MRSLGSTRCGAAGVIARDVDLQIDATGPAVAGLGALKETFQRSDAALEPRQQEQMAAVENL